MSSFIVEDKTINRIVDFCFWKSDSYTQYEIDKELDKLNIKLSQKINEGSFIGKMIIGIEKILIKENDFKKYSKILSEFFFKD
jgi:hypothetical protein